MKRKGLRGVLERCLLTIRMVRSASFFPTRAMILSSPMKKTKKMRYKAPKKLNQTYHIRSIKQNRGGN